MENRRSNQTLMTEIASLGKFELISHLTKKLQTNHPSTIKGIGDDAAVLAHGDKLTLIATSLFLEGIHFDLTYTALKFLGYKAAIAVFSDIYAMNGQPKQLILSIGMSKRFTVENTEELYLGIEYACEKYEVDIVGLKTTSSLTGLCISTTCISEKEKNNVVYRHTAKNTDIICVSGDLGAAYMGLQLLEREKAIYNGENIFTPDFAGKEYLLERQLRPEARKDIVKILTKNRIIPTSMIVISDGLASELLHICKQSNVGCTVYEERIPIDYQTAMMAEEFNLNLTTVAMNGGDDYELLFTVPLHLHEKIEEIEGIKLIGYICEKEKRANLITRDGNHIPIKAQGWVTN